MDSARAVAGSVASPERLALRDAGARGFQPSDRRALPTVGRTARLELTFERRGARTVLTRSYAEPPIRVGPAIDIDGAAYFIVVCAGPGIFGGDDLRQSIHVGRGARVVLTSQSALQVHPAPHALTATSHQDYRIDEDGELHAEWDPVIPFTAARFDQRITLDAAEGARLHWSDALIAGRAGRGEAWQFAALGHELVARVGGSLAYLERYRLARDRGPTRTWIAGGAQYIGTTLVVHSGATAAAAAGLHSTLGIPATGGTTAGVDCVQEGVVLARLLSSSGGSFAAARAAVRRFALESIFGRPATSKRK